MQNIKIMTFNIQAQAWPASTSSEAVKRAKAVIKALRSSRPEDTPDVVVFNEADNEATKKTLVNGLNFMYPNFIESFGGFPARPNDSGLAIFSRFPFVTLPASDRNVSGDKARFAPFGSAFSGVDGLADKGVGLVQISTGLQFEVVTIAFTHMQAFYKYVGQHSSIRKKQLNTISELLKDLLGDPVQNFNWSKVILMGDLNIRGDLHPSVNGEWKNVFVLDPGIYRDVLADGWRTFMKAPGASREKDPGLTNTNLAHEPRLPAGLQERLDYMCFPNPDSNPDFQTRQLIPHYMRILPFGHTDLDKRYRDINSDHKAILADIHWNFPNSSPSTAFTRFDFNTHTHPTGLVPFHTITMDIRSQGAYQWIYLNDPGTYTFFADRKVEVGYFFEDEVSVPVKPYEKIRVTEMGFNDNFFPTMIMEFGLDEVGYQVDVYKPVFIRIRGGEFHPDFEGTCSFGYIKHTGETWQTAIKLRAWDKPKNPNLPFNQDNGASDHCWFVASIDGQLWSGQNHTSQFYIENKDKKQVKVSLFDDQPPTRVVGVLEQVRSRIQVPYTTHSPQRIYMLLKRTSNTDINFAAGWKSEISYLSHSNFTLFCKKETSEPSASDEIRIKLFADDHDVPVMDALREDFDAGELKLFSNHLPSRQIGFKNHLRVQIIEEDDISEDDVSVEVFLPAIGADEKALKPSITRTITVDDGIYKLDYGLSRNEI